MSPKEVDRVGVLAQIKAKKISKTEAAGQMGISRQHVGRLYKKFCRYGPAGLVSKRRGSPSNNRIPDRTRQSIIELIRECYPDFNPGFAHEKLVGEHNFCVSSETVRQIMIASGLWHGKRPYII